MVAEQTDVVHNRIAMLRAERGISRRELAEALGVHYQTVGYLEAGAMFRCHGPGVCPDLRDVSFMGSVMACCSWRECGGRGKNSVHPGVAPCGRVPRHHLL